MLFLKQFTPSRKIDFKTLIENLDASVEVDHLRNSIYKDEEIQQVLDWVVGFASNKEEMANMICHDLDQLDGFQKDVLGQPQVFMLHNSPRYSLRLMLWIPSGEQARALPFSYHVAHDHAVDLLTYGFHGPGYRTSLYSFDYDEVTRNPSHDVKLDDNGERLLSEGSVLYYFANKDIHAQYEPEAMSASFNLIINKTQSNIRRQSNFEIRKTSGKVFGRPTFNSTARIAQTRSIYSLLMSIGNERTLSLVRNVATTHAAEEMRALAWAAILQHNPAPAFLDEGTSDPSAHVREVVANLTGARRKEHANAADLSS